MKIKGLHRSSAKGRTYYYAWKGGPRLVAPPGTDAFLAEVAAARAARGGAAKDRRTIAGLIGLYKAAPAWAGLSDKTKTNWAPWLDRIRQEFGAAPIAAFDDARAVPAIRKWRDAFSATPRSADMGMQVFSRLLSFAGEEGLLTANPCAKVPGIYTANRAMIIWTPEDIDALSKHASLEMMWAVRLAALTGLRQGDLLRLSWSHVGELAIEIPTGKSGGAKTTLIPRYDALTALLGTIPKRATTVLTNTYGGPWRGGFGSSFGKAKAAAKITHHFHDLRGTAATNFHRAGFTDQEIAEVMTWSPAQVEALIKRYVKRDELLRDRIKRMSAA